MELTPFHIQVSEKISVQGEYAGNDSSGRVVIFSHGFGVRRDSRGMFTQLGSALEDQFLVVRFDYDEITADNQSSFVHPYHLQAQILEAVISFVRTQFAPLEINIIAHSQGCFIVGLAELDGIHKIILNSSPTISPYDRVKERLTQRSGSVLNEAGISSLKRSDGSTTFFDPGFWKEMKVVRPLELYTNLAQKTDLYFIRALNDEIVTDGQYDELRSNTQIHYVEIPGNHNFSEPDSRQAWMEKMKTILE